MDSGNASDPGLLSPAETSLLTDQYELAMAASYFGRGMNEPAAFELFARQLPPERDWLMVAGLGPVLSLVRDMRFGERERAYLRGLGFAADFLDWLGELRPKVDIDAMPEGTLAFAGEPLLRVTGPRIEAQILETLLLNQMSFQTLIATKAARVVLAAGAGEFGAGESVIDFSPRRDHGIDAAIKAARSAAVAGCGGTSNVAAAMRYGLRPVGTMAHSYVMSFADERAAFRSFMEDFPDNAVMLVDTYDTAEGVRNAIAAARETGVALKGVRLDSGDLLSLSRQARGLLDEAGMRTTTIVASGDLNEHRVAELVRAGAPIDLWGVGTDLGTSRDSPALGCVYKLVANFEDGEWRGVWKRSADKATVPEAKQVFRQSDAAGQMTGDTIAAASEKLPGEGLLVPAMRGGEQVLDESLDQIRARSASQLRALPSGLRVHTGEPAPTYPVTYSPALPPPGEELA